MECNVLIVDDDKDFLDLLSRYLKNNNFLVYTALNVKSALKMLSQKKISLIISDVEMPGIDGYDFLKTVRESKKYSQIPFILMSGKKITEIDMIEGYEKGSDDYIIKPFSFPLMLSKIKAILKNRHICGENDIKIGDLIISEVSKEVIIGKKEVQLTKKEYELLLLLAKNKNRVFSPQQILDQIWGYGSKGYDNPHTVETHISSLRKKLGKNISKKIENVPGYGYKFEE
ncbi:MAG: response regulator transcription factor [Elusimicrobia bacterium]|jgi:DNA-binding response OmpR family regulator|nr:response regulator transcription factor [Elusimicrobiota bacterium]